MLKAGGHLILSTPMYWPRHEMPYDYFRYPYDGLLHLINTSGFELVQLFNRGRSYAFIGQVIQQTQPIAARPVNWLINRFFLWCDCRLKHDIHTLGWTVIAQKPNAEILPPAAGGRAMGGKSKPDDGQPAGR